MWSMARLPYLSLSPRVCSDSCPLSLWCYLTISSSDTLYSFCLQSFPPSGSFPMSQLFVSGGQSIEASGSVLPTKIQGWFPLRLTGFISLQSEGLSGVFSSTTVWKHQFFSAQPSLWCNLQIHPWLSEKNIALNICSFVQMWCFCFVIGCLGLSSFPSKEQQHLLISQLYSLFSVILEPKKIKCHCFHSFPFCLAWVLGLDTMILSFLNVDF